MTLEPTRTYSNHTATEVLRRLLDERGVEWIEHEAPAADCMAFFDGKGWHDCWEGVGGKVNVVFSMTSEQAVAATLGPRTCRIKVDAETGCFLTCSECGAIQPEEWTVYYCWSCGAKVVK